MSIVPVVCKDTARMFREKCMIIEASYMYVIEWSISYLHCHTFVLKNSNKTMKTLDIFIFITNNSTVTVAFVNFETNKIVIMAKIVFT